MMEDQFEEVPIHQEETVPFLQDGEPPSSCVVQVSENLDALVSNTSLAQAEVRLVNTPRNRFKVLASRMASITE